MSLFVKKGTIAYNPRTVTDGLIFYLDPNNAKCRSVDGIKFTDLIQKYSNVPDLSAGTLFADVNSLTSINDNIFLTLTGSNSLLGVVGPDSELSALENFTIQFWLKNNKPTTNFKNIFSNTNTPLLLPSTLSVTVSTNYPYSPSFGNFGINGVYNSIDLLNNRVQYQRRFPDLTTTRPFTINWSNDTNQWILRNNFDYATHFVSDNNVNFPTQGTWRTVLTTFTFNIGDTPKNFFGHGNGNTLDIFYPLFTTAYGTRPRTNTVQQDQLRFPRVTRSSTLSQPWMLDLDSYRSLYSATNTVDKPWQSPIFNFNTALTALSCSTNLNRINTFLSGGWVGADIVNDRVEFYRDLTPESGGFLLNSGFLGYGTGITGEEGWYVSDVSSFLLSGSNKPIYPWEVEKWIAYPGLFNNTENPYFSVVRYNPPPITAVPVYPEDLSNIMIIVSTDSFEAPNRGLFLSGTNNFLNFSYNNDDGFLPFNRTLFQTNTADWYCITLAQSGEHITLYKNSSYQGASNTSTKYFNLSGIFFGNDITLGQILLYDKCLSISEIKQNYNSFKTRYRSNEVIKTPLPVTYIHVTNAGLRWVNGIYTERGIYNGKKYYNLTNAPATNANLAAISWDINTQRWVLWGLDGNIVYTSSQDVEYPWEATLWTDFTGNNPPPPLLTPKLTPLPSTFTHLSYGLWVNGLMEDFEVDYPGYPIKFGSSWPPTTPTLPALEGLILRCDYVIVAGIRYDINEDIYTAYGPEDFYYYDSGFGIGLASYLDAITDRLNDYNVNISLLPYFGNYYIAQYDITTLDFEIYLTEIYEFPDYTWNQQYALKKENNEIIDSISHIFI